MPPTNLFTQPGNRFSSGSIQFRAGRLTRDGQTVTADPRKGLLNFSEDDGAIVLRWTDRTSNKTEEIAHLFPGQATFSRVEQCTTGRVYVLNFLDCDRQEFFWMQEPKEDKDSDYCEAVRGKLRVSSVEVPRSFAGARSGAGRNAHRTGAPDMGLLQQILRSMPSSATTSSSTSNPNRPQTVQQQLLELLSGSAPSAAVSAAQQSSSTTQHSHLSHPSPSVPQSQRFTDVSLSLVLSGPEVREALTARSAFYAQSLSSTLPISPLEDGSDILTHVRNPQVQFAGTLLEEALQDPMGFQEICTAFQIAVPPTSMPGVRSFLMAIQEEAEIERRRADTD